MKRALGVACALCAVLLSAHPASSSTYYGFALGTMDAPRPPMIRQGREPHAVLASDAMVYVVDDPSLRFDGDLFRYGQYWFAYTRGYWYRARSHRGPYAVLEVRKVPRAIIGVPRRMWKHHPLALAPARATNASGVARARPAGVVRRPGAAMTPRVMGPPAARQAVASKTYGPAAPRQAVASKTYGPAAPRQSVAPKSYGPAAPKQPVASRGHGPKPARQSRANGPVAWDSATGSSVPEASETRRNRRESAR
jgi:hypothetical protein